MPELPDVTIYVEAFQRLFVGQVLQRVSVRSPFLVRTYEPDVATLEDRQLIDVTRLGKRVVWELEGELFAVFHLMIAGRFHCRQAGTRPRSKTDLAAFDFPETTLMLTEASPKKRASLHLVEGREGLARHPPPGLEILAADLPAFRKQLLSENRTLKRSLTSPRLFSGIGNAYSDEILHAARLSPVKRTKQLSEDEVKRLYEATRSVMRHWIDKLRADVGERFPEKVTAFRQGMAVHGRFGEACPDCGATVQRIVFAENETNYCANCQTAGRLLKDRSLSRLLKDDWPRTLEEWEEE